MLQLTEDGDTCTDREQAAWVMSLLHSGSYSLQPLTSFQHPLRFLLRAECPRKGTSRQAQADTHHPCPQGFVMNGEADV